MNDVQEYECPECGGEMLSTDPDRICIECMHEEL